MVFAFEASPSKPFISIWMLQLPPKIKKFLQEVCNDGLPTKVRLQASYVFVPQESCFYNYLLKDSNHLLLHFNFFGDVFSCLGDCVGWSCLVVGPFSKDIIENLNITNATSLSEDLVKFRIIWWFIWFQRNHVIFHDVRTSIRGLASSIINFVRDQDKSKSCDCEVVVLGSAPRPPPFVPKEVSWSSPNSWFKLNFDGSKLTNGKALFGFTICNHSGDLCLAVR